MQAKINLPKGEYSIAQIRHFHHKDPDCLVRVSFLDYTSVFLDHHGEPVYKLDKSIIKSKFKIQRRAALKVQDPKAQHSSVALQEQPASPRSLVDKLNDSEAKLWIIVDAATDEEGERKATEIARTLKEVGLEDQYDQIVYGPKAFLTCYRLKANLTCESESEDSSQLESEEPAKPAQVHQVVARMVDSPSSSLIESSNNTGQADTTTALLTEAPFITRSGTVDQGKKLEEGEFRVENQSESQTKTTTKKKREKKLAVVARESDQADTTTVPLLTEVSSSTFSGESFEVEEEPKPVDPLKRRFIDWLLSSGFPTTLSHFTILSRIKQQTLVGHFNDLFLFAIGFDGYDPVNHNITSADGKTKLYTGTKLPFWLMLASFLGMPSRAESVIDGVPQFSGWQLLRNFFGVWIPVKETLSNQDGRLNFYQYRWTEKKIVQGLLLFFKLTLVLPIKLILIPFKIMLNSVKLVTEVLLPLISSYVAKFNAELIRGLYRFSVNFTQYSILSAALMIVGMIPLLAIAIIQYAMVWVCRIGLALTSPEKSARVAFALGYGLIVGEEGSKGQIFISTLMGGLGAIVSLALSAVLWTITLPLAMGTLVTMMPPLLNAVTWISQLPVVASSLTWLSQWHLLTNLAILVKSAMSTVGAGLTIAFGPVITTLATVMSIQIPAAVMVVGTVLGMIVIPTAAILSRVADELSNLWASWIEQKPFASLGRWISSFSKDDKQAKSSEQVSIPEKVFVYQARAGKELIVSACALYLKDQQNKALKTIEVSGDKAEALYLRAKENREYKLVKEGARFPTQAECDAVVNSPAIVI